MTTTIFCYPCYIKHRIMKDKKRWEEAIALLKPAVTIVNGNAVCEDHL